MILNLRDQLDGLSITEAVEAVLDKSGYLDALSMQQTLESQARIENIEEFMSVTKNFDETNTDGTEDETGIDRLGRFLNDLALIADTDDGDMEAAEVTLMTLHAAKGLEFPVVFLIGMEEGVFPLSRASEDPEELEEERRLAYVGITRAEEILFLTNANTRTLFGRLAIIALAVSCVKFQMIYYNIKVWHVQPIHHLVFVLQRKSQHNLVKA